MDDDFEFEPLHVEAAPSHPMDDHVMLAILLAGLVLSFLHAILSTLSRCRQPPPPPLSPGTHPSRPHFATPSTPRYGLALGEAASDDDSDIEDDLTSRELRRLQQSPQFHAWCRSRGLKGSDLEGIYSRQRLYRRLRDLDPELFWRLCRPDALTALETQDPGQISSTIEYLISNIVSLAAFGALGWCAWRRAGLGAWAAAVAAAWVFCVRNWMSGRPAAGPLCFAWYEDMEWGHRAPAARAALAGMLEAVYLVGSVGSGAAVSLAMRWRTGQSVGEKIAGVKMVVERWVRVAE